jgi:hypothetical protein
MPIRGALSRAPARAASCQGAAAPAISVMNCRGFMGLPSDTLPRSQQSKAAGSGEARAFSSRDHVIVLDAERVPDDLGCTIAVIAVDGLLKHVRHGTGASCQLMCGTRATTRRALGSTITS